MRNVMKKDQAIRSIENGQLLRKRYDEAFVVTTYHIGFKRVRSDTAMKIINTMNLQPLNYEYYASGSYYIEYGRRTSNE